MVAIGHAGEIWAYAGMAAMRPPNGSDYLTSFIKKVAQLFLDRVNGRGCWQEFVEVGS